MWGSVRMPPRPAAQAASLIAAPRGCHRRSAVPRPSKARASCFAEARVRPAESAQLRRARRTPRGQQFGHEHTTSSFFHSCRVLYNDAKSRAVQALSRSSGGPVRTRLRNGIGNGPRNGPRNGPPPQGKPKRDRHGARLTTSSVAAEVRRRTARSTARPLGFLGSVSGSTRAGPSLITPSSIVFGRSGTALPPRRSASESGIQYVRAGRQPEATFYRGADTPAAGNAGEETSLNMSNALFDPRNGQQTDNPYAPFPDNRSGAAPCRRSVGPESV